MAAVRLYQFEKIMRQIVGSRHCLALQNLIDVCQRLFDLILLNIQKDCGCRLPNYLTPSYLVSMSKLVSELSLLQHLQALVSDHFVQLSEKLESVKFRRFVL